MDGQAYVWGPDARPTKHQYPRVRCAPLTRMRDARPHCGYSRGKYIHDVSGQKRASICPHDTHYSGMGDLTAVCRRVHPRPPRRSGPADRSTSRAPDKTARPVATAVAGAAAAAAGRCRNCRAPPVGPPAGCPAPIRLSSRSCDQCDVLLTYPLKLAGGVVALEGERTIAPRAALVARTRQQCRPAMHPVEETI